MNGYYTALIKFKRWWNRCSSCFKDISCSWVHCQCRRSNCVCRWTIMELAKKHGGWCDCHTLLLEPRWRYHGGGTNQGARNNTAVAGWGLTWTGRMGATCESSQGHWRHCQAVLAGLPRCCTPLKSQRRTPAPARPPQWRQPGAAQETHNRQTETEIERKTDRWREQWDRREKGKKRKGR